MSSHFVQFPRPAVPADPRLPNQILIRFGPISASDFPIAAISPQNSVHIQLTLPESAMNGMSPWPLSPLAPYSPRPCSATALLAVGPRQRSPESELAQIQHCSPSPRSNSPEASSTKSFVVGYPSAEVLLNFRFAARVSIPCSATDSATAPVGKHGALRRRLSTPPHNYPISQLQASSYSSTLAWLYRNLDRYTIDKSIQIRQG